MHEATGANLCAAVSTWAHGIWHDFYFHRSPRGNFFLELKVILKFIWNLSSEESGKYTFICLFILFIYLFLAVLGLCCGAWASHCGGFSCCGARALGGRASVVVACGLSSCGARA